MSLNVRDANLVLTRALPNGAATVTSTSIDLQQTARGDLTGNMEILVSAPALTVGELANAATVRYDIITSANADLSSPTIVYSGLLTQTGAGGVGAAAATARCRLPSSTQRYLGFTATNSGAGNQTGKNATLALLF
jgi:hypothetical protein